MVSESLEILPEPVEETPFDIRLDPHSGIVRVVLQGFWNQKIAEDYVREFATCIATCRRSFGVLKLLSDARNMPIQTREITALITREDMHLPGDRVALVLNTALANIAARRSMLSYPEGVDYDSFTSLTDGESWLLRRV